MPRGRGSRRRKRGRGNRLVSASRMFSLANMISERKTTRIRLTTGPGSYSATAGGVLAGVLLVDPSITSYTEEKSIQALYSSHRLIAARLFVSPETGNTTKRSLWFASFLGTGLVAPTSYAQVDDNANVMKYANVANDTSGRAKCISLSGNTKLGFQEWGTASTDVSGAPGGFYFYGDGFTASQPVCLIDLQCIFECRNRV